MRVRMRLLVVLTAVLGLGRILPAAEKAEKALEKKLKASVALDAETGIVTISLRCTSTEAAHIHLCAFDYPKTLLHATPEVPDENQEVPDDAYISGLEEVMSKFDKSFWRPKPGPKLDRAVHLRKDECISTTIKIWESSIWDSLTQKLRKGQYKAYQIHPEIVIYVAGPDGKPKVDHSPPTFRTTGFVVDRKLVHKLEKLKKADEAKAAAKTKPKQKTHSPAK